MSAILHAQVQQVLEHLADKPAATRERVLERLQRVRPAVAAEVRSLLHYFDRPMPPGPTLSLAPFVRHALPAAPSTALPPRIGPYRIIRLLAQGGMGRVYVGVRRPEERRCAVKIPHRRRLGARWRRRFALELEVQRCLVHPAIGGLLDAGEAIVDGHKGRCPYLVTEYLDGALPITRYAAQRALGLVERLGLMIKVCAGMQHAHYRGILHLDLKPSNLLIDRSGEPRIIDFGTALPMLLKSDVTSAGACTPGYASPEQLSADAERLSAASDVYALGRIAGELLGSAVEARPLRSVLAKATHVDAGRRQQWAGQLGLDILQTLKTIDSSGGCTAGLEGFMHNANATGNPLLSRVLASRIRCRAGTAAWAARGGEPG